MQRSNCASASDLRHTPSRKLKNYLNNPSSSYYVLTNGLALCTYICSQQCNVCMSTSVELEIHFLNQCLKIQFKSVTSSICKQERANFNPNALINGQSLIKRFNLYSHWNNESSEYQFDTGTILRIFSNLCLIHLSNLTKSFNCKINSFANKNISELPQSHSNHSPNYIWT